MEINHSTFFLLKLLVNRYIYKFQQHRLATNETKVIPTSCGYIRGIKRKNVYGDEYSYYAFEGIPYGKPPLGDLRFRAPQPPDPWDDILDCQYYMSKPSQYNPVLKIKEGSEDCLYLNVYTRKLSSSKPLPVMVFIFGGAFQVGEANREIYSPEYFMQKEVILITVNYRLGVFGFLCLDNPDLNVPGNAGIKDQLLALKWVKENIHNFNGDPNNVTLFGESAGAASTHMLMITPRAEGLFHKAIMQSGCMLSHWSNTERHDWGFKLARDLGYAGDNNDDEVYHYLVKQDTEQLLDHDRFILSKQDMLMENLYCAFVPVIEPYETSDGILYRPVEEILPTAWSNNIPVIIGGNANEGIFTHSAPLNYPFLIDELDKTGYVSFLPRHAKEYYNTTELKEMGHTLKRIYFNDKMPSLKDRPYQYFDLTGDNFFWIPMSRNIKARRLYATDAPTYCYYFEFDSPDFNHARSIFCNDSTIKGACHADEVSYLFGNVLSRKLRSNQKEYICMQRMIGMWYSFALTSNPNCKEIAPTVWKVVDDIGKPIECLCINDRVKFTRLPIYERLQKCQELYSKVSLF